MPTVQLTKLTWLPGADGVRRPCQPGTKANCSPDVAEMVVLCGRGEIVDEREFIYFAPLKIGDNNVSLTIYQ